MVDRVVPVIIDGKLQALPNGDRLIDAGGNVLSGGLKATVKTRLATTGNIADLIAGAPNIVDDETVTVGDRVLVKDQIDDTENGIYVVNTVGTGSNGVWARTTDFDDGEEFDSLVLCQVIEGGVNGDTLWEFDAVGGITVGTSPIIFIKVSRDRNRVKYDFQFYLDGQNQLSNALIGNYVVPRNGYLVSATVAMENTRTSGTVTLEPHINGTGVTPTNLDLIIDGTNTNSHSATVAYETTGFEISAGDRIGFRVTSTTFTPLVNIGYLTLEVEYNF